MDYRYNMCNSIINLIQNTIMDITGKKISILGAGKSGLSAAKLASFLGAKIIKIENLVEESKHLSDTFKRDFKNREISEDRKLQDYSVTLDFFFGGSASSCTLAINCSSVS